MGADKRAAAHEVLREHPDLIEGDAMRQVHQVAKIRERPRLWHRREVLTPTDIWHNVKAASEAAENLGMGALAAAELNPEWVVEQLTAGEIDVVLVTAQAVQLARETADVVSSAYFRHRLYLD